MTLGVQHGNVDLSEMHSRVISCSLYVNFFMDKLAYFTSVYLRCYICDFPLSFIVYKSQIPIDVEVILTIRSCSEFKASCGLAVEKCG